LWKGNPMKTNLDPCREVTQDDWLSIESPSKARGYMSIMECATCIVRLRVAEALADTVPKAQYEAAVRRLAKIAVEVFDACSGPEYSELCGAFGVDPKGGDE